MELPPTAFCTATSDGEQLALVNLAGLRHPAGIKERILSKLRIPDEDFYSCVFHLTRIGAGEGRRIDDDELWDVCQRSGTNGTGVTIFVKQSNYANDNDFPVSAAAARHRQPQYPSQYHNLYIQSQYQSQQRPQQSKSVANLHAQFNQDQRTPPSPFRTNTPLHQSGHPNPYPRPPPPPQQNYPRHQQAYPSFDPRVMRAPVPTQPRLAPPYANHIPISQRSTPTLPPQPPQPHQFWPPQSAQYSPHQHHISPRQPEISGRITLRPGETLQQVVRRSSEGQPEPISLNRPPMAAHMRSADPSLKRQPPPGHTSPLAFESESGRYAIESVPSRRESAERERREPSRKPRLREETVVSGPASASARSSGSSFASYSSSHSQGRRKSAPEEVYGGLTDDSGSHRTTSSTRSSTTSATGPLTPLTPVNDYLSPLLPLTKSPPAASLEGLGIDDPKLIPLQVDFGDEDDETGTWQAGKAPSPFIDTFDDEDDGAATWLVTPERPTTPSTLLAVKTNGITLKDEPSSRSPNRKEPRPSLRVMIDHVDSPGPRSTKSAESNSSTATTASRRLDRGRPSLEHPEGRPPSSIPTPCLIEAAPPMLRRSSYARSKEIDSDWAFRPPVETVLENLDEYFPEHDLDLPLVDAGTPPIGSRSPVASPVRNDALSRVGAIGATALKYKKSIRKVAQDRKKNLALQQLSTSAEEAEPKDSSLLRRKSTKLWGNRVEEVTPEQAKLMSTVAPGAPDDDPDSFSFKWVKGELIGRGTYGQVYLALNVTTGDMLAVKQVELPKTRSDKDDLRQQVMVSSLKAEIELLKDLDHGKIVQYLGFEETISHLSIFLEYVPGGSVGRIVRKHGKFEEGVTKSFTRQILEGLEYLHGLGILHRDLKADNILCDHVGNCKISDFGTSKKSNDIYNNDANMSMQGSIFWMAPEVVQNWKKGYSAKADIWSLGCICLEMWAGRRPWSDEEAIQAMFKLGAERLAPPIPADVVLTDESSHFLAECFRIDPEQRPTASHLRRHVFLELPPDWNFLASSLNRAITSSRTDDSAVFGT